MKSNVLQLPTWVTIDNAKETIPEDAWDLLSFDGSLTERFRTETNNVIEHRLLSANWGTATAVERQALNLESNERTWIRRIEWRFQNTLWLYARAVFPEATIKATGHLITGLGVQSLGDVIFKDPSLKREPFFFSLLEKDSVHYTAIPDVFDSFQSLWARHSVFYFRDLPFLITEIFTPDAYAERNA